MVMQIVKSRITGAALMYTAAFRYCQIARSQVCRNARPPVTKEFMVERGGKVTEGFLRAVNRERMGRMKVQRQKVLREVLYAELFQGFVVKLRLGIRHQDSFW